MPGFYDFEQFVGLRFTSDWCAICVNLVNYVGIKIDTQSENEFLLRFPILSSEHRGPVSKPAAVRHVCGLQDISKLVYLECQFMRHARVGVPTAVYFIKRPFVIERNRLARMCEKHSMSVSASGLQGSNCVVALGDGIGSAGCFRSI